MESLQGKVAIITGASAGIGQGTALLLARYGCLLTITGRDEGRLSAVAQQCKASNCPKVVTVIGDVRDTCMQQQVIDDTLKAFGQVDILVNNVGTGQRSKCSDATLDLYNEIMDVNLKSAFFLTQKAIPHLIKTKGSIVNVSSVSGQVASPVLGVYNISKAAMDMYTKCLALELASHGVRVNSVNPGHVVSMITRRGPNALNDEQYEKFLELQAQIHPLGRVGTPEDVAMTIAYLVSDMSSFTTGQLLFVDGGRHCVGSRPVDMTLVRSK